MIEWTIHVTEYVSRTVTRIVRDERHPTETDTVQSRSAGQLDFGALVGMLSLLAIFAAYRVYGR